MNLRSGIVLYALLSCIPLCVDAQMFRKAFADSIKKVLASAKHDTTRLNCLFELGGAYSVFTEKLDSADLLAEQVLALANRMNHDLGRVKGHLLKGSVLHNRGKHKEHTEEVKKGLDICRQNFEWIYEGTREGEVWVTWTLNCLHGINWSHIYHGNARKLSGIYEEILNEWRRKAPPAAIARLASAYGTHLTGDYIAAYDKSILYFQEALTYFERVNDLKNMAEIHYALTGSYQKRSIFLPALKHVLEGLKCSMALGDTMRIMDTYHRVGGLYNDMKDHKKALEYYFKEKEIRERVGNIERMAGVYMSIGITYFHMNELEKAMDAHRKSLEYCRVTNNWVFGTMEMNNVAIVLLKQGKYQEAIDSIKTSVVIRRSHFDQPGAAWYVNAIGDVYLEWGKPLEALDQYKSVADTVVKYNDQDQVIRNRFGMAHAYYLLKEHAKAISCAKDALAVADRIHSTSDRAEINKLLSELYESTGDASNALWHFKRYTIIKDSISDMEKSREMGKVEAGLEFEIQQALKDAEYKKNLELSEEREKRQEIISWMIGAATILVIGFLFFVFNRLKITRRQKSIIELQHEEVNRQKDEIEEKNKEITSSIQYAKRIQSSLLPSERYVERKLRELRK